MKYIKLCEICDFQGGSQPPKDEWSFNLKDGYVRMLQIRDFTQSEKTIPEYVKLTNRLKICCEDDILIARYGASLGKILTGLAGAYNVAIMKAIPDLKFLEKRFLYYYLKSHVFQKALFYVGARAAQAGFNKEDLRELQIPFISKDKQKEIISILDRIDKIILMKQTQNQYLDNLIKARFVEMFGDPIRNSKNLPTDKISERYFLKAGITTSADEIHDYSEVYKTPCFGGNGVRGYVKSSTYSGEYPIIGRQGALCGNIQFATGNFHATEHAVLVTILQNDNVLWVYYLLKFMDLNRFHTGAAQPGLSVKTLNTVDIITVDRKQQDEFASFAKQIDKSKVVVQQSLEKAQMLFDSLMQQYFG